MIGRYVVETEIALDTIHDSSDWDHDKELKARIDSGEVVILEVSATVFNLISGARGNGSLCGITTEAFAVNFSSNGREVLGINDSYVMECLYGCIDEAKAEAGVI